MLLALIPIQVLFLMLSRYQNFVRGGGSANFNHYLESILPSLIAGIGDRDYQPRGRRSGGERLAGILNMEEAAKEKARIDKLAKASSLQVLLCYFRCPFFSAAPNFLLA